MDKSSFFQIKSNLSLNYKVGNELHCLGIANHLIFSKKMSALFFKADILNKFYKKYKYLIVK
jgi:hypothetical protein